MLIPPDEHALLLAERWLKLLSNLGRAQATLTAYGSALRHYFAFCSQNGIKPEKARFEDLAAYISPQLPGMPLPAASATLQLRLSAIRLWYDFLVYQGICSLNPLPRAGLPGNTAGDLPHSLSLSQHYRVYKQQAAFLSAFRSARRSFRK